MYFEWRLYAVRRSPCARRASQSPDEAAHGVENIRTDSTVVLSIFQLSRDLHTRSEASKEDHRRGPARRSDESQLEPPKCFSCPAALLAIALSAIVYTSIKVFRTSLLHPYIPRASTPASSRPFLRVTRRTGLASTRFSVVRGTLYSARGVRDAISSTVYEVEMLVSQGGSQQWRSYKTSGGRSFSLFLTNSTSSSMQLTTLLPLLALAATAFSSPVQPEGARRVVSR